MNRKSSSQSSFSNTRRLIGVFVILLGVFLALVGSGVVSKGAGHTKGSMESLQTAVNPSNARPSSKDVADNPNRYLDEKGNRVSGIKPSPAVGAKHRAERPAG